MWDQADKILHVYVAKKSYVNNLLKSNLPINAKLICQVPGLTGMENTLSQSLQSYLPLSNISTSSSSITRTFIGQHLHIGWHSIFTNWANQRQPEPRVVIKMHMYFYPIILNFSAWHNMLAFKTDKHVLDANKMHFLMCLKSCLSYKQ